MLDDWGNVACALPKQTKRAMDHMQGYNEDGSYFKSVKRRRLICRQVYKFIRCVSHSYGIESREECFVGMSAIGISSFKMCS